MRSGFTLTCGVLLALTLLLPAHSARACTALEESAFRESVVDSADMIVVGEVLEYSNTDAQVQQWTQLRAKEVLKGTLESKNFTVKRWQANHPPMFTSRKGDKVLLFIRGSGKHFSLTNDRWNECVPSVIPVGKDDKLHPPFTPDDGSLPNRMEVRSLVGYLLHKK